MVWTKQSPQWAIHSDGYETASVDRDYAYFASRDYPRVLIWRSITVDLAGLADYEEYKSLPMAEQLRRYVTKLSVASARLDPPIRDLTTVEKRMIVEKAAEGWRFLGSRVQLVD